MEKLQPLQTLTPLSEEFIAEHNLELFDLWLIMDEESKAWGPFETESLKELSGEHQELFETYNAFNLATEKEKPFFQNTKFQRRKPKLVSLQGVQSDETYHLLIQGIKKGPFDLEQIKEQVDSGLSLNTLATTDKGQSWIKLFEHHEFDRRLVKNKDELPFSPEKEILEQALDNKFIKNRQKEKEEEDAIVGLAFIGKGNDKGQRIKQISTKDKEIVNQYTTSEEEEDSPMKFNFKYIAAGVVAVFMIFSGINTFNSSFQDNSQAKQIAKVQKKKPTQKLAPQAQRKPAKVIKAKKYRPLKKKVMKEAPPQRRKAQTKRKTYREIHSEDDFESHDVDDPYFKANDDDIDLRGIASDELSEDEIDFIERAESGDLSDKEMETYQNFLDKKRDEFQIDEFE